MEGEITSFCIASRRVRYSLIETGSLWLLSLRKKSISMLPVLYAFALQEEETMTRLIASTLLAAFAGIAAAQNFPTRPVTLIVPFPPGGSTDTTARSIAERMRTPLGQTVVIENAGGASGSIALARVARANPDGYTIDIGQWDTHVGNIIYPLTYDLAKDFDPIGLMTINAQLMIARKDFPAGDLKGLVAWMKSNPGKLTLVEQT